MAGKPEEETKATKRPRRLIKQIENDVLTIQVVGVDGALNFDHKTLPPETSSLLPVIALSHILGDSAAGTKGVDAAAAINAKWAAMMEGKMTTRKAAAPSVKQSELLENFAKLSDKEKKVAAPFLAKLGVDVSTL